MTYIINKNPPPRRHWSGRLEYAAEALTAAALISLPFWWHYAAAVLAAVAAGWL